MEKLQLCYTGSRTPRPEGQAGRYWYHHRSQTLWVHRCWGLARENVEYFTYTVYTIINI